MTDIKEMETPVLVSGKAEVGIVGEPDKKQDTFLNEDLCGTLAG